MTRFLDSKFYTHNEKDSKIAKCARFCVQPWKIFTWKNCTTNCICWWVNEQLMSSWNETIERRNIILCVIRPLSAVHCICVFLYFCICVIVYLYLCICTSSERRNIILCVIWPLSAVHSQLSAHLWTVASLATLLYYDTKQQLTNFHSEIETNIWPNDARVITAKANWHIHMLSFTFNFCTFIIHSLNISYFVFLNVLFVISLQKNQTE